MLDWMKHKLESVLPGEISITSDTQTHTHTLLKVGICKKTKETASLWMHLKDSQQAKGTEFWIFASYSQKEGAGQARQSRNSQSWGHAVLTWSSAPFKSV